MEKIIEGNALVKNKLCKCSIGIEDGKITQIKKILHGKKHFKYQENLIIPAAIDVHVHFRDPGMNRKEDFYTGTMAAAHGGVSCILDMPNTQPPTITYECLDKKIRIAGMWSSQYNTFFMVRNFCFNLPAKNKQHYFAKNPDFLLFNLKTRYQNRCLICRYLL